ncbi:MAG: hypothetical protein WCH04_22695 [Gammaproteobacteria bacterium]
MTLDAPDEQGIGVVANPTSLTDGAKEKASAERVAKCFLRLSGLLANVIIY